MFSRNIRLILNCCKCNYHSRKFSPESTVNSELISEFFGMPITQSTNFVEKFKIGKIEHDRLLDVLKYLNQEGFTKSEILNYPRIMTIHPITIEHRLLFYKEIGFVGNILAAIHRYFSNKKIEMLKAEEHIPGYLNVAENYKQYLKPLPEVFNVEDLNDEMFLGYVHLTVVKRYLSWRLNASTEQIERLFRIHKMIQNKSLVYLCENISIAEELGFTSEKLLKCGYILHNYPKYTRTALKEFPNLAGVDLRKQMRMHPKLIMVSPRNYIKIYGILKEHNFSDEVIGKSMHVFLLSPETLKQRLQEVDSVPELKVLLHYPRILNLIVQYNRARSRLSFIQQLKLKCAHFVMLATYPTQFESFIREGKDKNTDYGVDTFLCSLFNVTNLKKQVQDFWRRHPFHLNVPYTQMEETFHYLKSLQYNNSSILKAIHIILYPRETVEKAILDMQDKELTQDHELSQVQQLNLMLYYIEKEHHFTGNGVWRKTENVT